MPGHSGLRWSTSGAANQHLTGQGNSDAYRVITCGHCDTKNNAAVLVAVHEAGYPDCAWLRCTACHKGVVILDEGAFPGERPGEDLEGLPVEVDDAYTEARDAMSVHAYTAGELMCRKILMHVAVDKGAAEGETFAAYLDHLETEGFITPPMKPWADVIRQHGNLATHEIPPSDEQRANGTLAFTTQLLRLIYEMDHKVAQFLPPPPTATGE